MNWRANPAGTFPRAAGYSFPSGRAPTITLSRTAVRKWSPRMRGTFAAGNRPHPAHVFLRPAGERATFREVLATEEQPNA
jgi:hypothetical protein